MQGFFDVNGDGKDCQKTKWDSSSFFIPQAAIGFFSSITSSLLGSVCSTSNHISEDVRRSGVLHKEEVLELCNLCTVGPPLVIADLQTFLGTNPEQKVKETETLDSDELPFLAGSNKPELFRQFDMVSGCSDHNFVDGASKNLTSSQVRTYFLLTLTISFGRMKD